MKEWEKLELIYNMNLQAHTRKQVQMHMTAKIIAEIQSQKQKTLKFLQGIFRTIHLTSQHWITAERFVGGEFTKYVNNDGNPCRKVLGKSSLFEQAEALVQFSYEASNEKFLLVDLQGVDYEFYHPEIATIETLIEPPLVEKFFCPGNLRETVNNDFFTEHKCNVFFLELKIAETELGESEEDEE